MKTFQIAVRDFALPIPRRGSIDVHSGYNLINYGQEIHDLVQQERKKEDPFYKSEVKISRDFERGEYKFCVGGRVDGLFDRTPTLIEEIKSTVNVHELRAKLELCPDHPYILQVKTYAYFHYLETGVVPQFRLHLVSSTNINQRENMILTIDLVEYEAWLDKRLDELVYETKLIEADVMRRIEIAGRLQFPFDNPRTGQTELMASISEGIGDGKQIMVQAPTGLGKTMSVSFPALKDALSRGQKLVYLTPKNSQHKVAEDAIEKLKESEPELRLLTINAKSKICFKEEQVCTPEYCEYARDYYKKVYDNKLIEVMADKAQLNFDLLQELGKQYEVCPFELSVDSIARSDVIVGDYNYVFSPRSLIGRITNLNNLLNEKPNLVIDEAHNLPDRACDYYSPVLSSTTLEAANEKIALLPASLAIEGQALVSQSIELIKSQADKYKWELAISLNDEVFRIQNKKWREFLAKYLGSGAEIQQRDAVIRAANSFTQFTEILDLNSDNFFTTAKRHPKGVDLKITCCDASSYLKDAYAEFNCSIAFSATMKPFDYYSRLSGFNKDKMKTIECQSPFPRNNRKLLVIPQVSTKYSDRQKNYAKIADAIGRIVNLRRGNYFVFFPSFEFLSEVASRTELPAFDVLCQEPDMKSSDARDWIDKLHQQAYPTIIFAVQGGTFSEGIDYPGNSLIGAIIVGPALPKFDLERERLKDYYQKHYNSGFDYAYTYPAMTRVIQSAGRVIRSENDRGVIVLMDQRFVQNNYVSSMPSDWFERSVSELVSRSILKDISEFWTGEPV